MLAVKPNPDQTLAFVRIVGRRCVHHLWIFHLLGGLNQKRPVKTHVSNRAEPRARKANQRLPPLRRQQSSYSHDDLVKK